METICKPEKALEWVKNTSYYFLKNLMTVDEAKKIWNHIKGTFSTVAARSGISSRCMGHLNLLRKMQLVKDKAESEEAEG